MAKRMLADVLWKAANKYPDALISAGSCCAVAYVLGITWGGGNSLHDRATGHPVFDFLKSLGCTTHSQMFVDLGDEDDYDVKGARHMWLLLAMHVAEDEGIEI